MELRRIGVPAITLIAGLALGWWIQADRSLISPLNPGAQVQRAEQETRARAALEMEIADLKKEIGALRQQSNNVVEVLPSSVRTPEEKTRMNEDVVGMVADAKQQVETEKLLAAGFSKDRIEWIRKRTGELEAEYTRDVELQRVRGYSNPDAALAHFYDSDIGLRRDLGELEYTKYRQALGRSARLKVRSVGADGAGVTAGLRPGDEIISYNGIRVFNYGELSPLMRQYEGTSVSIEVHRDGQRVQLNAAGGNLKIQPADPIRAVDTQALNSRLKEAAKELEAKYGPSRP